MFPPSHDKTGEEHGQDADRHHEEQPRDEFFFHGDQARVL
jgi:hypothetical protein